MQTDSSAMATCLRLRSTVECTATVLMPRAWQARRIRSAISPRLAMTIFSSMGRSSADDEHGLVELDRLAVLDQDRAHRARDLGLDGVEHLHRLDDAQRVAGLDLLADLHEGRLVRAGRRVEGADHGRTHHVAVRDVLGGLADGLGGGAAGAALLAMAGGGRSEGRR